MAKLIDVATQIKDLYFQNFASNDSFFEISDFKKQVANVYSFMLDQIFQGFRKMNKAQDGFANVEIPPQWTIPELLEIQLDKENNKYYAVTSKPIYAFFFDNNSYALMPILASGNHCNGAPCEYRRISTHEKSFIHLMPVTSRILYCLDSEKQIVFFGAKEGSKVLASYIPQVVDADDNCLLSDNIIAPLTDEVLKRMMSARSGTFVDKTDDQNPNPQQQSNK